MSRRGTRLLSLLAIVAGTAFASGCASTATVVPGQTLALFDVRYPDFRAAGVPVAVGDESPMVRMGRAILRELVREGHYRIVDARHLRVRPADLGKDAGKTSALLAAAPADAYLGIRLFNCAARPASATETRGSGPSAVTVTVYWFSGECTAELSAYDSEGKTLAILQRAGRWDSPRQDRPDGGAMQSQTLSNAVDDAARRLAREIRPIAGKQ